MQNTLTHHETIMRLVIIGGIILGGHILYQLIFWLVKKWGSKKKRVLPPLLQKYLLAPGHLLVFTISIKVALPYAREFFNQHTYGWLNHALEVTMIAACGYFIARLSKVMRDLALHRYVEHDESPFALRKAKTKFELLQRVLNFMIMLGTVAIILMTFDNVRQIGGTLLASAGVFGIIIGFAAQRSLGSLFAGIQIAISQPIRIDDVVVVEGEFGTIGEINLTYVVIHTWDGRRKIVPINYFLENSFENWTRVSPEVVGKVKIYVDYNFPVDELREIFAQWLKETKLWDGRKSGMLVTDSNDKVMEIRATMSAKNSDDAWDLECLIREKMIAFVREKYPDSLPLSRVMIKDKPGDA